MSAQTKKTTARKSRQRATRDLPLGGATRENSVTGGATSPQTGGVNIMMCDGSVKMGDGSVRFVSNSVTTPVIY
jgi:prepilin-type processing-associated H-X9-DG protein